MLLRRCYTKSQNEPSLVHRYRNRTEASRKHSAWSHRGCGIENPDGRHAGATCIENRADQLLTRGLDVRDVQYTFLHNLNDLKSGGPPAWRSAYHFLRRYPDSACGRKLILMMRAANERLDTDFHGAVAFYAQQGKELAEADDRLAIECVTARGDATGTS